VLAVFSTALLLGLAWGCSASSNSRPSGGGSGGNPGIGEAGNDEQVVRPGSGDAGEGSLGLNPLCGKAPRCVPDDPGACSRYAPPAPLADASVDGDGAPSAQAGQSGEGGAAGESSAGAGGMSAAGAAGASGEAGAAGASGAPSGVVPLFSCQVQRSADAPQTVVAQCAVVGSGGVNAPCLSSSDCGWDAQHGALGCVGDASSGLCEPYCCKGDDTCAVGSYCAERPLRDALVNEAGQSAPTVMIPVCVPAQNCDLSTPYPCPAGTECACKSDTACVVVRADGTTTCAVPGVGKVGDACPCAWGHVCSVATNQCLKLCYTRGTPSCGTGTCQASADLPDGWGVCVGSSLPSGG
jgi:hypothetical protein